MSGVGGRLMLNVSTKGTAREETVLEEIDVQTSLSEILTKQIECLAFHGSRRNGIGTKSCPMNIDSETRNTKRQSVPTSNSVSPNSSSSSSP